MATHILASTPGTSPARRIRQSPCHEQYRIRRDRTPEEKRPCIPLVPPHPSRQFHEDRTQSDRPTLPRIHNSLRSIPAGPTSRGDGRPSRPVNQQKSRLQTPSTPSTSKRYFPHKRQRRHSFQPQTRPPQPDAFCRKSEVIPRTQQNCQCPST